MTDDLTSVWITLSVDKKKEKKFKLIYFPTNRKKINISTQRNTKNTTSSTDFKNLIKYDTAVGSILEAELRQCFLMTVIYMETENDNFLPL